MEEKEKLSEKGVKIRVIGNLKLLPADLQKSIADAVLMTKDNNKSILNVAFAYTSRDEITHSIETIVKGFRANELQKEDLNYSLIDECLYTNQCRDVDLLVRTSGEMRFSDFLLWQVRKICFLFLVISVSNSNDFRLQQQFTTSQTPFGLSLHYGIYSLPCSIIKEATTALCSLRAICNRRSHSCRTTKELRDF